jgi:hypothetical protein
MLFQFFSGNKEQRLGKRVGMFVDDSAIANEENSLFKQARFSAELNLTHAKTKLPEDARKAIRREYRDSEK